MAWELQTLLLIANNEYEQLFPSFYALNKAGKDMLNKSPIMGNHYHHG